MECPKEFTQFRLVSLLEKNKALFWGFETNFKALNSPESSLKIPLTIDKKPLSFPSLNWKFLELFVKLDWDIWQSWRNFALWNDDAFTCISYDDPLRSSHLFTLFSATRVLCIIIWTNVFVSKINKSQRILKKLVSFFSQESANCKMPKIVSVRLKLTEIWPKT